MRAFLAFSSILAVAMTTAFAGFIWWVPLVGTFALCATSQMWTLVGQVHRLGLVGGALPYYLRSLGDAALAQSGACILGLAVKMVF